MFYLVGIGLKPEHLTIEAINILKTCDQIFLESYTSQYSEGLLNELQNIVGKTFKKFGRIEVEEQMESALLSSKKNNIALMIFGNPLTATTHIQLLLDAKEKGIKTKIIPGISISNMIAHSGLDEYKFGRTVTICYHENGFEPESFYDQIMNNKKIGLHTLCLLDIKKDSDGRLMIEKIQNKRLVYNYDTLKENKQINKNNENNINDNEELFNKNNESKIKNIPLNFIGLVSMGGENEKIIVGKDAILKSKEILNFFPQSLIIIGKTNQKEEEVLERLF